MNVRNSFVLFGCVLLSALMIGPVRAAPVYFGDAVWERPGLCGSGMFTQHLCFPNGGTPARTAAEYQIIAPYVASGYAPSELLFVGNRQPSIDVDIVVTSWTVLATGSGSASFANRSDAHLHVMVDGTLAHFGMNTGNLPGGTLVVAKFGDGSKAVFKLILTGGTMFTQAARKWVWTGEAWNAEGFEIDRTGNMRFPIYGPPTYEPGFGGGAARRVGTGRVNWLGAWMGTTSRGIEIWSQTVSVVGGGTSTRFFIVLVKR